MPGAHLSIYVFQTYGDVGVHLWIGSWFEGDSQWFVGFYSPRQIWEWWMPAKWRLLGWERWAADAKVEEYLICPNQGLTKNPGKPKFLLRRTYNEEFEVASEEIIHDPAYRVYDIMDEYVKGSAKGRCKGMAPTDEEGKGAKSKETSKGKGKGKGKGRGKWRRTKKAKGDSKPEDEESKLSMPKDDSKPTDEESKPNEIAMPEDDSKPTDEESKPNEIAG